MNKEPTDQNDEAPVKNGQIESSENTDQENNGKESVDKKDQEYSDFNYKCPEKGGCVCITYGRDQIMNKQVVSLIRELGFDPIVMQDKDNSTKPLAQFVTDHKDISFVIAILSADDWVYPKKGKPQDALMYADQRVVFHLGFWIGLLGRNRVFALYYDQRSFRWPTEHFDVIYTPLDKNDSWKKELVSRLKECGINIL